MLGLAALSWLVGQYVSAAMGSFVTAIGWALLGLLGVFDGMLRLFGYAGPLGDSSGSSRLLSVVQILLSVLVLFAMLNPFL